MFISGYYTKILHSSKPVEEIECPHCKQSGNLSFSISCRILHLMYIPTWASGKSCSIVCESCSSAFPLSDIEPLKQEGEALLKDTSLHLTSFLGSGILLLFAGLIISVLTGDNEALKSDMQSIRSGYVISYTTDNNRQATCMYIDSIKGDTIFARRNIYTVTAKELGKIDKAINYKEQVILTKQQIQQMYDNKTLLGVDLTPTYVEMNNGVIDESLWGVE